MTSRASTMLLRWWPVAALGMLASVATLLVASLVFPDGSVNLDEVAYRVQADTLRAGSLTLDAATFDPDFMPFLSGTVDERVLFKYQPLWPATIAAADVGGGG